jgi:hypothetical protein
VNGCYTFRPVRAARRVHCESTGDYGISRRAASNYVVLSGTATCNDQDIWDEAHRIIERYRAPDEVDEYLGRWKTEPRVLIPVTPERISTRAPRRR